MVSFIVKAIGFVRRAEVFNRKAAGPGDRERKSPDEIIRCAVVLLYRYNLSYLCQAAGTSSPTSDRLSPEVRALMAECAKYIKRLVIEEGLQLEEVQKDCFVPTIYELPYKLYANDRRYGLRSRDVDFLPHCVRKEADWTASDNPPKPEPADTAAASAEPEAAVRAAMGAHSDPAEEARATYECAMPFVVYRLSQDYQREGTMERERQVEPYARAGVLPEARDVPKVRDTSGDGEDIGADDSPVRETLPTQEQAEAAESPTRPALRLRGAPPLANPDKNNSEPKDPEADPGTPCMCTVS